MSSFMPPLLQEQRRRMKDTKQKQKLYPDSGIELTPFLARHYDTIMNTASFGLYRGFIRKAVAAMNIQPNEAILDLGCGTGRNACLMHGCLGPEGRITGMDVSQDMERQFNRRCGALENISFVRKRIDQPFELSERFDRIFSSFVIHGFPHDVRHTILKNIFNHLKSGGRFCMLDFAEFDMQAMPFLYRFVFTKVECRYAFDFIEKDWKQILSKKGFGGFEESFYFKKYIRMLKAEKA